jgi:hypothetical protein
MKALQVFLSILAVLVIASPLGGAQTPTPIKECTAECDPKEANGGAMKKGDEVTKVILYGHFEDILNMAPLNTQIPDSQREPDLNRGFLMPVIDTNTGACAPGTQTCADFHFKNNEFTMFSSPGLVEYLQEGWRTHQEPGLADDAEIADATFNLYWYMSAHAVPQQSSTSGLGTTAKVGVTPQIGVYARMETGRFKYRGDEIASNNFNDQPNSGTRQNLLTSPQGDDVYEFIIPMAVKSKIIPSADTKNGFIVFIQPYQIKQDGTSMDTSQQFMQADWRVRTGPSYPPRVVIPILKPMSTRATQLNIFEDRMFVRWSFTADFGSYDMKDNSLQLVSTGQGAIDSKAVDFIILKRSVDHDGHFKPVNATWAIDYLNFPLADGSYELTASIMNLQETYLLEHKFAFNVVGGVPDVPRIGAGSAGAGGQSAGGAAGAAKGGDAAGLELVPLLGAIGVAAMVVVRRRKD